MFKFSGTLQKTLPCVTKEKFKYDFFNLGYSLISFHYYNESYPQLNRQWKMPWMKALSVLSGIGAHRDNFSGRVIKDAVKTYDLLPKDEFSLGNRYRAYSRYHWCSDSRAAHLDGTNEYFQDENYNYVDGGKIRQFAKISPQFLNNDLVGTLLTADIEIAHHLDVVTFDKSLEIGLHQIRYKANQPHTAYSSPAWLHRDDEPVVFVHVLNYSSNVIGAENIIARNGSEILRVVKLQPLETMLLGKSVLHAVTPMSSFDENFAVRDILLVTFMNKKKDKLALKNSAPAEEVRPGLAVKASAMASNVTTLFGKRWMPNCAPSLVFSPA